MAALVELTSPARLRDKEDRLFEILRGMGRMLVAFSGGTDSAYLAWAAHRAVGAGALAVTADSASIPESHKRDAEAFAAQFGIAHEYIETREFENPDYTRNDPDRCFHCKDELFTRLEQVGRERGFEHIIYGVNVDDLGDYRPGQTAATQHRVAAPLASTDFVMERVFWIGVFPGITESMTDYTIDTFQALAKALAERSCAHV